MPFSGATVHFARDYLYMLSVSFIGIARELKVFFTLDQTQHGMAWCIAVLFIAAMHRCHPVIFRVHYVVLPRHSIIIVYSGMRLQAGMTTDISDCLVSCCYHFTD